MFELILAAALTACPAKDIVQPQLQSFPSDSELAAAIPPKAARDNVHGEVKLRCEIGADGAKTCTVLSEVPEGYGFADAALKLVQSAKISPRMVCGAPVSGGVHFDNYHF